MNRRRMGFEQEQNGNRVSIEAPFMGSFFDILYMYVCL